MSTTTRILYAEDDPGHARLAKNRLQQAGYAVTVASTAEQALEALAALPVDALLTDLSLPGMSGLDLLKEVSGSPRPVPTVVVTGKGSEGSAVEAMKHGAMDYVIKDVEGGYLDLIPVVIESSLRHARAARERQEALEALRESELQYRRLFDNVPIGLYRLSPEGTIIDANPMLAKILGENGPDDLKGKNLIDYYAFEADRERRRVALRRNEAVTAFEARMRDGNGRVCWILEHAAPAYDQVGCIQSIDGSLQDASKRKSMEDRLAFLAAHDALTKLPNRALLEDRLGQALNKARRDRTNLAVLLIDVDRFKRINDRLGHEAGDEVLVRIARALTERLRASDTVARLGGDEFVAVLPDVRDADACIVIARQMTSLARGAQPPGASDLAISVSVGIALFPDDGTDAAALIRHADAAMYVAKRRGGNGCERFASSDES